MTNVTFATYNVTFLTANPLSRGKEERFTERRKDGKAKAAVPRPRSPLGVATVYGLGPVPITVIGSALVTDTPAVACPAT
jgi:hypothetical protein